MNRKLSHYQGHLEKGLVAHGLDSQNTRASHPKGCISSRQHDMKSPQTPVLQRACPVRPYSSTVLLNRQEAHPAQVNANKSVKGVSKHGLHLKQRRNPPPSQLMSRHTFSVRTDLPKTKKRPLYLKQRGRRLLTTPEPRGAQLRSSQQPLRGGLPLGEQHRPSRWPRPAPTQWRQQWAPIRGPGWRRTRGRNQRRGRRPRRAPWSPPARGRRTDRPGKGKARCQTDDDFVRYRGFLDGRDPLVSFGWQ
jgi:hypothetical protein